MRTNEALSGDEAISAALDILEHNGKDVDVGRWQGVPTGGRPDMVTREIINMSFTCEIPQTIADATEQCQPNIPWAENHFQERVSRQPLNPECSTESGRGGGGRRRRPPPTPTNRSSSPTPTWSDSGRRSIM